ncbi:unnamed protein product [Protopolystoma xenopodis]|uniref:Misato Segment II tubulin-like domain-containing protein n=1 Tax=Protopolystoma xenopodis TaxID=117903 RepID=A0A3S5AE75_9PLAT|nr:unnamed protein product [Protopolystoma xenopodis]
MAGIFDVFYSEKFTTQDLCSSHSTTELCQILALFVFSGGGEWNILQAGRLANWLGAHWWTWLVGELSTAQENGSVACGHPISSSSPLRPDVLFDVFDPGSRQTKRIARPRLLAIELHGCQAGLNAARQTTATFQNSIAASIKPAWDGNVQLVHQDRDGDQLPRTSNSVRLLIFI